MNRFVERLRKLPAGFVTKPAGEKTVAFKYLSEQRRTAALLDNLDLMLIIDDKHPDGGLLYVFKDHSSIAFNPELSLKL